MKRESWCTLRSAAGLFVVVSLACGGGSSAQPSDAPEQASAAGSEAQSMLLPESAACGLPAPGYGSACDECLAERCCAPIEECKGDASCADQLTCVVRCQLEEDPGACSEACLGPDPHAGYLAYENCSFDECLSPCWD